MRFSSNLRSVSGNSFVSENDWQALGDIFLPEDGAFWRSSRVPSELDAWQGYKIHVSAHQDLAVRMLRQVGPLLEERRELFKAPKRLSSVGRLNSGLYFGFGQIGKILTIYPRTDADAIEIATLLVGACRDISGPEVPTDFRVSPLAPVFVRYGAYRARHGESSTYVVAPDGRRQPDIRSIGKPFPDWISNPFQKSAAVVRRRGSNLLCTRFLAFQAISQRGKGGVYKALDLGNGRARLCILKEGRRNAELELDGREAPNRLSHEAAILRSLYEKKVKVPRVIALFTVSGDRYLALSYIEGRSLRELLDSTAHIGRRRRIVLARNLCLLLRQIHALGWAWRDLKPSNILISKTGEVYAIDFEGACRLRSTSARPWGTPAYQPRHVLGGTYGYRAQDIYALAVTFEQIWTGGTADSAGNQGRLEQPYLSIRRLIEKTGNPTLLKSLTCEDFLEVLKQPLGRAAAC